MTNSAKNQMQTPDIDTGSKLKNASTVDSAGLSKSKRAESTITKEKKTAGDKEGKTKRKRRFKAKKLVLNVSQTKYNIVRYVARTIFKMRLSGAPYMPDYSNPNDEWDLLWTDGTVQVDKLYRMKPYQRINHFPGMYALARKNHLAINLSRMQNKYPEDYKFFP